MGKGATGPVLFYEQEGYELSMFAARRLRWKDQDWTTGEHIFQAENFVEDAGSIRERIRLKGNPSRAKKLAGRLAKRFPNCVRPDWKDGVRDRVMASIIDEIVLQYPEMEKMLLKTGSRMLIENSPHPYWGWGEDGKGKNRLGKLWMRKRTEIESAVWCT